MLLGEFLDMSLILDDIKIVIRDTNYAMTNEVVYDRKGINDNFITRRMMKGTVENFVVQSNKMIIDIHTSDF